MYLCHNRFTYSGSPRRSFATNGTIANSALMTTASPLSNWISVLRWILRDPDRNVRATKEKQARRVVREQFLYISPKRRIPATTVNVGYKAAQSVGYPLNAVFSERSMVCSNRYYYALRKVSKVEAWYIFIKRARTNKVLTIVRCKEAPSSTSRSHLSFFPFLNTTYFRRPPLKYSSSPYWVEVERETGLTIIIALNSATVSQNQPAVAFRYL